MKTSKTMLAPVCLALLSMTPAVLCAVTVGDLRCEYLKDPLGIDVRQPRLSWKLIATDPAARGQKQTGYRILVASAKALLDKDQADLWDSGMVASDQSVLVAYHGKSLTSGMECFWKVLVKDEHGAVAPPSPTAHWTMGLLEKSDWSGQWIGAGAVFNRATKPAPQDCNVPDPWLRKTFELRAKPERATVYVASVGYHELYVNGRKVGDAVLSPCVTDHRRRARYVTYEIADRLNKGRNVIALWLGTSWSIFPSYRTDDKPQAPIALAQADIRLPGGDVVRVVTDETWRVRPSPNALLGVWDFMHFGGERYDADQEVKGWCDADLDDSAWKPATVYTPTLVLSSQMVEPNRQIKEIRPVGIEELRPGVYRVDLGVNVTGWFKARVQGKPGDRIDFKFSERPAADMTHALHSQYIIGPSGKGTFSNRFNYFTGRWVTIEGLRYKPALKDIRARLVRTDYAPAADFECSNDLLNRIYRATLWTFEDLTIGGYVVDCPHRERMGYGGDAHATIGCALNNFDLGAFYTKWSQDWRDVQSDDGDLPHTAPTYWGGGGPAWGGFCITLPWEIYRRYGDTRILEQNVETIQRWLAFLETHSKDNLLQRWGGDWDFLGDWLWPGAKGINSNTRESLFFNNCYWIYNLHTAAQIAQTIGNQEAASQYRGRAQAIRAAVHREFFVPGESSYANGFPAYMAIALLTDVPPENLRPAVWHRLEDEILVRRHGHIYAGITGGAFLYKTLLASDRQNLLFAMANKDTYPGWGDMLRRGETTMAESWDMNNSMCHSSYLYIGAWFIEGLAGIKADPQTPGFKRFVLRPGLVDDPSLRWVKAHHDSIYGRIVSDWSVGDDRMLTLKAVVPPNTTATLYLPTIAERTVVESGRPLSKAAGVRRVAAQVGWLTLELQPGTYEFKSRIWN